MSGKHFHSGLVNVGWMLGLAVSLSATAAHAATLNAPSQYATIQAAIDAAQPGDQVVVADGVYTGAGNKDLDFAGKAITVRSASGDPAACIIDCDGIGRGFYFHTGEGAASVLDGFTIRNGNAEYSGGVYCTSSPTLTNCTISGNTASGPNYCAGGGFCCRYNSPTLTNCTISGNTASGDSSGGGMHCNSSSPTLTNCTISGNTTTGIYSGGGVCYYNDSSPTFTNCTISGNTDIGAYGGGGVSCYYHSEPTLMNCTIIGNSAVNGGGGVSCCLSGPTLTNCTISGNTASDSIAGGGVMAVSDSSPTLINCTLSGNTATGSQYSGCVFSAGSEPALINCTISGNTSSGSEYSGAVYSGGQSNPKLANCILWGDTPQEIYAFSTSPVLVTYCDVQGGYDGTGNTDADPLLADPDGPDDDPDTWQDNDYRLSPDSPCLDAGSNSAVPSGILTDMDGRWRFVDDPAAPDCPYAPGTCGTPPIVDMGAYEYQGLTPRGDLNCDGVVAVNDIAPFLLVLTDSAGYATQYAGCPAARADLDDSGTVDGLDVQPFVNVLMSP